MVSGKLSLGKKAMSVHDPLSLGKSREEEIVLFAERPCGAHDQYCLLQKNDEEHMIDIVSFSFADWRFQFYAGQCFFPCRIAKEYMKRFSNEMG